VSKTRGWCAVVLAAVCCLVVTSAYAELKISGYTQARYNHYDDDLSDDADGFDLRRVRVKVAGPVNDDGTKITLQVCLGKMDDRGDNSVALKDATISHPLSDEWTARLGFASMEFGLEVPYSSSKRLPLERSQVAGKLFPGERDTGLYLYYKSERKGTPNLTLGYSNDLKDNHKITGYAETGDCSALVARAEWPLHNDSVAGVSYLRAKREGENADGTPATPYDNDVWGAHLRHNGDRGLNLQAEYFDGERKDKDVSGWYATLEYKPEKAKHTFFYRYDTYDDGVSSHDDYVRHTVGNAWDVGKNSRITLQYEDIDTESGATGSNVGLQWQTKY